MVDFILDFIVHGRADTVGVAVRDVPGAQTLTGWNMEKDETLSLESRDPVALGHKVALVDIARGEKVVKYNRPIGNSTQDIARGSHVHTHNLKTARWQQ
jgi:(2R)-sulfolactate sulfo-lyase subunit alpha